MLNLRGLTLLDEPYVFSIVDGPTRVDSENTVLTMKKNSPILKTKSIVRCYEDIAEMDLVYDKENKFIGRVIYDCGFSILCNETNEIIPIRSSNKDNYSQGIS